MEWINIEVHDSLHEGVTCWEVLATAWGLKTYDSYDSLDSLLRPDFLCRKPVYLNHKSVTFSSYQETPIFLVIRRCPLSAHVCLLHIILWLKLKQADSWINCWLSCNFYAFQDYTVCPQKNVTLTKVQIEMLSIELQSYL